jgi:hypothetical protein
VHGELPGLHTADIQVSVQYLVNGIRSMARRAAQPIAIIGISQGGLLPRFALTYWPIQSVCPGRQVSHIGTILDSVTFAAFTDAIAHTGAARVSRLPEGVCAHPFATGLDEAGTNAVLGASGNLITPRLVNRVPRVMAEPPVRAYARRTAD